MSKSLTQIRFTGWVRSQKIACMASIAPSAPSVSQNGGPAGVSTASRSSARIAAGSAIPARVKPGK
jgi:hypothetical protein